MELILILIAIFAAMLDPLLALAAIAIGALCARLAVAVAVAAACAIGSGLLLGTPGRFIATQAAGACVWALIGWAGARHVRHRRRPAPTTEGGR